MNERHFESGDNADLEALFDSIVFANVAGGAAPAVEVATPTPPPAPVVAEVVKPAPAPTPVEPVQSLDQSQMAMNEPAQSMFNQIGQLTRKLHNALHELGFDKSLEKVVADTIPDARDRLAYIAKLTEQAADKVLSAIDVAKPIQEKLATDADELSNRWNRVFAGQSSVEEFKILANDTRNFVGGVSEKTRQTDAILLEIMMAQDFQDLTGQVIKKIVDMAKIMETQLFGFLVEFTPSGARKHEASNVLENGPVVSSEGRSDVVTDQEQVDDLLASLGF